MKKSIALLVLALSALSFSTASVAGETTYSVYCDGNFYYNSSSVSAVKWAISTCERNGGTAAVFKYAD